MPGTTPVYGFPYPEPTDLVADYPALGQDLAEDIEAVLPTLGGFIGVAPTSIANSGGSASTTGNTTTYTGVTSISLNGIFSATYTQYRLVWTMSSAAGGWNTIRLRVGGTDNTTSNYYDANTRWEDAGTTGTFNNAGNGWIRTFLVASEQNVFTFDISNPFATASTILTGTWGGWRTTATTKYISGVTSSFFTATTSFDGITMIGAGALTGTVSVFGYKK